MSNGDTNSIYSTKSVGSSVSAAPGKSPDLSSGTKTLPQIVTSHSLQSVETKPNVFERSHHQYISDTPLSPKAMIFSPSFRSGTSSDDNQSSNTKGHSDDPTKNEIPNLIEPHSKETDDDLAPSKLISIQDIQEVSPFSSFSGPSNNEMFKQELDATNHATRETNSNYLELGVSDTRRPSYASQITNSSHNSGVRHDSLAHSRSSSPTNTTPLNMLSDPIEDSELSLSHTDTRGSKVNTIIFPQPVCFSYMIFFCHENFTIMLT